MDIYFKSRKLQKTCNLYQASIKEWGPELAKKLHQRLYELNAAESLADISHLPPPRLHELEGQMKGRFAVDLKHPYRLIFESAHDTVPSKEDGSIDRAKVTAIYILAVEDYH